MDIEEWLKVIERVRELLDEIGVRLKELNELFNKVLDEVRIVGEEEGH